MNNEGNQKGQCLKHCPSGLILESNGSLFTHFF